MGSYTQIIIYDKDKEKANEAINSAFKLMSELDDLLSAEKNNTQVAELNQKGILNNPDPRLVYVIRKSIDYSILSRGAFDITIRPEIELYRHTFNDLKRPPSDEEIKETLKLVNYQNMFVNDTLIKLKPGMKIELGGIATGFIIDEITKLLKSKGIEHAMINDGGDIRLIGNKDGIIKWNVALQDPVIKQQYVLTLKLENISVTTSGNYERYFDKQKKFTHIIDARTGYSPQEFTSVTVIAENCIDADAIPTSVFVLGVEEGMDLINYLNGTEALFITTNDTIIKSKRFDDLVK